MRHDGRAEDAGGEEDALRGVEAGREEALDDARRRRLGEEDLEGEGSDNHAHERGDHGLQPPEAALLQSENGEGREPRDDAGGKEGEAAEEVEPESGPDQLGEVGRHRDRLGLKPEPDRDRPGETVAAHLGEVPPGRDAELGAHRLDEHRHDVRGQDHPEEQVAVLRARGHIRREVAGVDVRDRRDERGPEKRPEGAEPAPPACQRLRRCPEHARLAGQDRLGAETAPGGFQRRGLGVLGVLPTRPLARSCGIALRTSASREWPKLRHA